MQKKMKSLIIGIIALAVIIPILWYTLSPLFIDKVVNEEIPIANEDSNAVSENASENIAENIDSLYIGNFKDADSFHKVSGTAKVISQGNSRYLRFEDFQATNGPDLYVYLSTGKNDDDFVNLGKLKGNIGNQNYEIPSDADLEKYGNVLIWCQRFSVLFGSAELR